MSHNTDSPATLVLSEWTRCGTRTKGNLQELRSSRGGNLAAETIWTIEDLTGNSGWESAPINVEQSKSFALCFALKCIGQADFEPPEPRNEIERTYYSQLGKTVDNSARGLLWPRVVDFVGVELEFLDHAGEKLSTRRFPLEVESHTGVSGWEIGIEYLKHRNDMTRFWLPVELLFSTPPSANQCKVRFIIESRALLSAGIALAGVTLKRTGMTTAPAAGHCRFVIRTIDPATRQPLGARISIVDQTGRNWTPEMTICGSYPHPYFYSTTGEVWLDVPVGRYVIEAVRGFEHEMARADARYVREGVTECLDLELPRRLDLAAANWYSGDHHLHLCGHVQKDYPAMDCQYAMELGAADGQSYFPFQMPINDYLRASEELKTHGAVGEFGFEVANHLWGHFCTFGAEKPYENAFVGHRIYPTMYDVVRTINARGGACVAAHPTQMIRWPANTIIMTESMADSIVGDRFNCAKELPLILLLGEPCAFDLLIADGCSVQAMATREYYRLLNFGFHVAACGSSDTGANSASSLWPTCRTYVKAGELSFAAIARGYREGRTFATNGPVIRFQVNGVEPGDTVTVAGNSKLQITLESFSPWGLSFVEIILNGQVIERRELSGHPHRSIELDLAIHEPGWISAVVRGPGSPWVNSSMFPEPECNLIGQIAHTSPVYLKVADRPFHPPANLVDYYKRWVSNLREVAELHRSYLEKDAAAAGVSPQQAWATIMERIETALNKISRIQIEGWS